MTQLSTEEIGKSLEELPGWNYVNDALVKECNFDTYMDGISFVNRLAEKAEEQNHHPDLEIGWCRVGVTFTSHDSGGVTERDIKMAKEAENLL
ncbi:MAG: 4a-hydroxytetrahydrobiopterin dehydratase [Candidatus Marinimicrobia bacterium]|mgnify:CR=1 FL=1|nr:4a-hydroxytetrahydrobiopterin dehydratase [Candidatus Neomarinimicrobiota bacterium]